MLLTVAGASMLSRMRCTTGRTRCWAGRRRRRGVGRAGGAGEVEQVGALGVVEPQRVGERVEDGVGGAAGVAALQALVVLDAHPGQRGDLLAPQPGHPPLAVARQAGLLGRDLGPPGGQELRELACRVHRGHCTPGRPVSGVPCQYPSDRASQISPIGCNSESQPHDLRTEEDTTVSTENTTGRVAVITGASSGIGEATARALAADGHRVALLARRVDRIQALADELGEGAVAIEADVTDRDSIVAAAQRVQDDLGGADILVNNAGVMLLGPFSAELSDDYRRMIETNLLGAITTTEVFLDQLIADGGGDLINLSSVAGRTARAGQRGLCRDQVGDERLVRVAAPAAAARRARDRDRARRGRHRAHRPHHPRRDQGGRRADV